MSTHQPKDTWMSPKVHLVDSHIQGKGLQAIADIEPGETVLIWRTGYTDRAGAMAAQKQGKGIMQWDENVFSYDVGGDDKPYAINHSCNPNTWMADAYTIVARRAINVGNEITADYALWEMREDFISSWICQCGAANCRGHVTGNDWKDPQLQQRYAGHFSPLINGWIQSSRISTPDVLILSGTVGAGKTAVSQSIHDILSSKSIPHACLDLDCFSYSWPPFGAFNSDTVFDALEKVWPVYQQNGASKLILARVVESEAAIKRYAAVLKTNNITLIRVTASEKVRKSRLTKREAGESLTWHLNRTTELEKILEELALEDFVITNENRPVEQVAKEALKHVNWLPEF